MSRSNVSRATPAFGDHVRIRSTPETQAAGLAGLMGTVYGVTTPSILGVEVIGTPADDLALSVYFEDSGEELWFAPDLLEVMDHAAGTEIRLDGVAKRWVRTSDGKWLELPD